MSDISDNEILHNFYLRDSMFNNSEMTEFGVILETKCDSKCDSYPKTIQFDEKKCFNDV